MDQCRTAGASSLTGQNLDELKSDANLSVMRFEPYDFFLVVPTPVDRALGR